MAPVDLTIAEIARRIAAQPEPQTPRGEHPQRPAAGCGQAAAVLLPLLRQGAHWRLLYIRRAHNQRDRHSGEVAFPGGCLEPGETDPVLAALREAREEIGLEDQGVQLLGRLPPFETFSGYLVSPVVAAIPWPLALRPDPAEVAAIFSIPLAWLADPDHHEIRPWPHDRHPQARPVVFFRPYQGERLWGVSARITLNLLEVLAVP